MDFRDTEEDAAFRAAWREWLESNAERRAEPAPGFGAGVLATDQPGFIERARAWQQRLAADGWAAIRWPREHGGRDATPQQVAIYLEEATAFDLPHDVFMVGTGMVGPTLIHCGNPEQQQRFLPPLLQGSELWCQLWSEPEAGSDLASLRTGAKWSDERGAWILNGQKTWTSYAHWARWGYALVRTDRDAPKHAGITAMLVDMEADGVEVRPLKESAGGATFNEVFLTDVEVPPEGVLGELNDGWRVALTTLAHERWTAGLSGLAGVDVQPLLRLARETEQGGKPAASDPAMRQRLAEAWTLHKLLDLTVSRSLTAAARGGAPGPEGSTLKLAWSRLASLEADLALDLLGLQGTLTGSAAPLHGEWAAAFSFAPSFHLGGGTDQIQRTILAERILGLPKPPREAPASNGKSRA